jgi:hypothetical protein
VDSAPCVVLNAGPNATWNGIVNINQLIPVSASTGIRFRMYVQDIAGNWNRSLWYYSSSHRLANFLLHDLYLALGQHYDIRIQVRNMETSYDNVTLNLTDYGLAYFLPTTDGEISFDRRGIKVGLHPHETKEIYVRILTSNVRQEPFFLNLTASSEVTSTTDLDNLKITVGYPAAFPGLTGYSVIIIIMISLLISYVAIGKGLTRQAT